MRFLHRRSAVRKFRRQSVHAVKYFRPELAFRVGAPLCFRPPFTLDEQAEPFENGSVLTFDT